MKISEVRADVVRSLKHDARAVDNSHEAVIVQVVSDDGLVGAGEGSGLSAAVKAVIDEPDGWAWSRGIADLLIGEDPRDPRLLWEAMRAATWWSTRSGIGHVALAAVDMALWDLAGKIAGEPVWRLLGGVRDTPLEAYITLYQGPTRSIRDTIANTIALLDRARGLGFSAAKVEALPDTTATSDEIVALVNAAREHVGPEFKLLCDVGYRWSDADEAIDCICRLDEFALYLLEAPLLPEDTDGYSRLASAVQTPIAGAEILTSYSEFAALMDSGVRVVQPAVSRVGITETCRLADRAATKGATLVPFGWVATALAVAGAVHVAAATPAVPLIEYAPPSIYSTHALRHSLALPEPGITSGVFVTPNAPGLGVSLSLDAFDAHRLAT